MVLLSIPEWSRQIDTAHITSIHSNAHVLNKLDDNNILLYKVYIYVDICTDLLGICVNFLVFVKQSRRM